MSNHVPLTNRTSRRHRWMRHAASVAVIAALAGACSSSSDEVPGTTLDGSIATTLSPEAEGPQPGLEPGSNLPPDRNSDDPSNGDTDMAPATSASEATGG